MINVCDSFRLVLFFRHRACHEKSVTLYIEYCFSFFFFFFFFATNNFFLFFLFFFLITLRHFLVSRFFFFFYFITCFFFFFFNHETNCNRNEAMIYIVCAMLIVGQSISNTTDYIVYDYYIVYHRFFLQCFFHRMPS